MEVIKKYTHAITSAVLMCLLLCIIYPHYQYYIDPDGTSYLTIAQRYANGDYHTAINGYWSPWSCWLTAALIKTGLAAIPASVIINTFGGLCFLFISQSFFLKFNITDQLQRILCFTLAIFLCYAIFWQSFDDLWECFFLLSTLRIILADDFKGKPILWILCGILGSLAYFAKAYSFPFFILNTVVCTFFICKGSKIQWLKISLVSIVVMMLFSLPWILLLHNKYGFWMTSTAGTLNMSWYLVGHPHWKQGIDLLIPPAYKGSPYYWEDPYLANGDTPHFWDSLHLAGLQVLRAGYNVLKLLVSMVQLSVLFPLIAITALFSIRSKSTLFAGQVKILIISCLLFPIGYVLINFESRYLWYMLPLGMLLGAILIQNSEDGLWKKVVVVIFPLTFLIYPVYGMLKMYDVGRPEYFWAQELKKNNVQGSFASMNAHGVETQTVVRLAYFSGCNYYDNWFVGNKQEMIQNMRKYNIKYYIVCTYSSWNSMFKEGNNDSFFSDVILKSSYESGTESGIKVFRLNN